jgi:hypothetical protein
MKELTTLLVAFLLFGAVNAQVRRTGRAHCKICFLSLRHTGHCHAHILAILQIDVPFTVISVIGHQRATQQWGVHSSTQGLDNAQQ